jgi:hypothetical protein
MMPQVKSLSVSEAQFVCLSLCNTVNTNDVSNFKNLFYKNCMQR